MTIPPEICYAVPVLLILGLVCTVVAMVNMRESSGVIRLHLYPREHYTPLGQRFRTMANVCFALGFGLYFVVCLFIV